MMWQRFIVASSRVMVDVCISVVEKGAGPPTSVP